MLNETFGKLRRDGCGGLDEEVVAFHPADISTVVTRNSPGPWRAWRVVPIGEVETVVDGLDASGIDSIHFDAMPADLFRDGKDGIGSIGHESIGDVVLARPENSHVSAAPYQLCI